MLLDKDLHPLALPSLAEAPAGTAIEVTGYADMPVVGGYSAIEVLQISLESLPFNVGEDTDGDLLADVWELRHFGTLAYDGAANEDGSAYSLAQEYLEGTDPTSSSHSPPVGPQALRFMHFELFNGPPSPQLRALWPERYASAVDVLFESSTDLLNWNILPALPATDAGSGWFTRGIAFDAPRKFFQPKVKLKR